MTTIADQLTALNTIKTNIKAAIEGKNVPVGTDPFNTYAAKIASITTDGGSGSGTIEPGLEWSQTLYDTILAEAQAEIIPYTRPVDWLTLPTVTAADNKIVGLVAILPGLNYVCCTVAGAYTVDWGDGNIENVGSGVRALHTYNYNTFDVSNTTLCSRGYKQAIVTITPQAGQYITSFTLNPTYVANSITNVPTISNTFLDIKVAGSTISTLSFASASNITAPILEQVAVYSANLTSATNMFNNCYALQSIPVLEIGAPGYCNQMFYNCYNLLSVPVFDTSNAINMTSLFYNCWKLVVTPRLVMTKATNTDSMFYYCYGLKTITMIDLGAVTTAPNMFRNCYNLKTIPLLNTSTITDMSNMFANCYNLLAVPLLNTSAVTIMLSMFTYCYSLQTIPLFNTSNVTIMSQMFSYCYNLQTIPLLNTIKVTDMGSMFAGCYRLIEVPLLDTQNLTSMASMFSYCYNLQTVPLFNTVKVTSMTSMFNYCYNLLSIPLFNTSNVTDMSLMFYNCMVLKTIPLLNTTKVTAMNSMFYNCNELNAVPQLDTSNVTTMAAMFSYCYSLLSIPLLNTIKVTNMGNMFSNCVRLISVPYLNTAIVTNMVSMFSGCVRLIEVSFTDTSKVTNMTSMFSSCVSLLRVSLPAVQSVIDMSNMFSACYSLEIISLLTSNVCTTVTSMIANCYGLYKFEFNCIAVTSTSFGTAVNNLRIATLLKSKVALSLASCKLNLDSINSIIASAVASLTSRALTFTGNCGLNEIVSLTKTATLTLGSNIIVVADTSNLQVGMSVSGTGIPSGSSKVIATFAYSTNICTSTGHGMLAGTMIYISSTLTSTTLDNFTPYYLVNVTNDTFQLALSKDGAPISLGLSANATGVTIRMCTVITEITSSITFLLSAGPTITNTYTLTFSTLKSAIAAAKNITLAL